ncbi:hypothetical protein [Litorilituus lipolyticus]|uniref:Uncharacterized protein n=1 Tax=Litorilituus lipolyticus TaxID=2491017 RepID=A0A502KR06_9GAMM|nr:hypothetical protein [Litorilituus lipolyticus]TPH13936.1 hypothetical protein EPA86_12530 [Litorilituus lipolyticus]
MSNKGLICTIESLIQTRNDWEVNEYKSSNLKLYRLLDDCYQLATEFKKSSSAKNDIEAMLKARKMQVRADDSILRKLLKLVFASDKRRVSAYAKVVEVAISEKISPKELPRWIDEKGGIEEIRTANTKSGNAEEKINHGKVIAQKLAPISTIPQHEAITEQAGLVVLIANVKDDFSTEVLYSVNHQTVLNSALKELSRKEKTDNASFERLYKSVATTQPGKSASVKIANLVKKSTKSKKAKRWKALNITPTARPLDKNSKRAENQ